MMDKLAPKLNKPALNKLKIEKIYKIFVDNIQVYKFNLDIISATELIFD